MAEDGVEIRLSTVGAEEIQRTLASLSHQFETFGSTMQRSIASATMGALGNFATLSGALYAAAATFKAFVMAGLESRDMLDKAQISLTTVLESLYKYPGAADQHAAASKDAADQLAILKDRSSEVLGSLESLVTANQRLAPAMAAAGVASTQQAADFTMLMAKIGDVTGQSYESVAMQMQRMITTGRIARGEIGQTLRAMGVTNETIQQWKALGTAIDGTSVLIKNLSERFKSYEQGQKELLETQAGLWKSGWKALQGAVRDALDGVDGVLKDFARIWRDTIVENRAAITEALRSMFNQAAEAIKPVVEAVVALTRLFGPLIVTVAVAAAKLFVLYEVVTRGGKALWAFAEIIAKSLDWLYAYNNTLAVSALNFAALGAVIGTAIVEVVRFWKVMEEGAAKQSESQAWSVLMNNISRLRDKAAEDPTGSKELLQRLQELADQVEARKGNIDDLRKTMIALGKAGNDAGLEMSKFSASLPNAERLKELDDALQGITDQIEALSKTGISRQMIQSAAETNAAVEKLKTKLSVTTDPFERQRIEDTIIATRALGVAKAAEQTRALEALDRRRTESVLKAQDDISAAYLTGFQKQEAAAINAYNEEMLASRNRVDAVREDAETLSKVEREEAAKRVALRVKLDAELEQMRRKHEEERADFVTGLNIEILKSQGREYEAEYAAIQQKLVEDRRRIWEQSGGPLYAPEDAMAAEARATEARIALWQKTEAAFSSYERSLNDGLDELNARWLDAGSAEEAYAQQVQELKGIDRTEEMLAATAAQMATNVEILTGGLIPAWVTFGEIMTNRVLPATDAARKRLQELSNLDIAAKKASKAEDWDAYLMAVFQKNLKTSQSVTEAWQNALRETAGRQVEAADTVEKGLAAGLKSFAANLGTVGKDVAAAVTKIGEGLTDVLSTTFFDVITGRVEDLKDVFRSFGEMILKTLTDIFAKILMRYLMMAAGIEQNPITANAGGGFAGFGLGGAGEIPAVAGEFDSMGNPMGGGYGGNIGGGFSSTMGGVVGGIGLGLGAMTLANAQNTGQTIGGVMQMVGGVAAMIPAIGWVVGAILVAVGALINVLSKPPEIQVPVHVGEEISKDPNSASSQALLQSYGRALGGLAEIARAGGGNVADILRPLTGGEIPNEFFQSQQVTVHAGSQEDIQKDWEAYLKTYMPQAMMSFAFGRQITGWSGDNAPGSPGIRSNPIFGDIDFEKGVQPIVAMMQQLGFANSKIQEIARQIDLRDPEQFVEWLTKILTAVRSMKESTTKLGRTAAEIVAEQEALQNQTPAEAFREPIQNLLNEVPGILALTGDEAVNATADFADAVAELIRQEEAAIMRLHEMAEAIKDQAKSLRESADAARRTPTEQLAYIGPRIAENFQKIIDATNPNDVQKAWDQFYSDMTYVINGIVARIQAMRGLIAEMKAMQEAIANGPMADPQQNPYLWLAQNAEQITKATTAFRGTKKDTDEQVTAARTLFGLIQQRYQFELQMLERIKSVVESVGRTYEEWVFQTQLGGMTNEHDKGHALLSRIQKLQEDLRGAKSPEEAERIFNQILGLANQMLAQPQDPANAEAARAFVMQLMADTKKIFDSVTDGMKTKAEDDITELGKQLKTFTTEFGDALDTMETDLGAALTLLDTAATNASTKLNSFADALVTEMGKLTDALIALRTAITGGGPTPEKPPKPTEDPGEGYEWTFDEATNTWIKKKLPRGGKEPSPGADGARAEPGGSKSVRTTGAPGDAALVRAGGPTVPLTINVDVTSSSPDEIAAAVAANVAEALKDWTVRALKQNNADLLSVMRQYPVLMNARG